MGYLENLRDRIDEFRTEEFYSVDSVWTEERKGIRVGLDLLMCNLKNHVRNNSEIAHAEEDIAYQTEEDHRYVPDASTVGQLVVSSGTESSINSFLAMRDIVLDHMEWGTLPHMEELKSCMPHYKDEMDYMVESNSDYEPMDQMEIPEGANDELRRWVIAQNLILDHKQHGTSPHPEEIKNIIPEK